MTLYTPLYWSSRKLRRVARSSSTAEILAAADAVDMASYLSALAGDADLLPRYGANDGFPVSVQPRNYDQRACQAVEQSRSVVIAQTHLKMEA